MIPNDRQGKLLAAGDLKLGDKIEFVNIHGFCGGAIKEINRKEESLTIVRPYIHTADFSCSMVGVEKVIVYTGHEYAKFSLRDTHAIFSLVNRSVLK